MTDTDNREAQRHVSHSIFLNEGLMAPTCALVVLTGLACLYFYVKEGDSFEVFQMVTKLVTAVAMFFSFRYFKWDIAKGLMGGVLYSLMFQEAFLVLTQLWNEADFDTYLAIGPQGAFYLAAADMALLMTIIITINHFFINYELRGNMKNAILNRIAINFKFVVYAVLFVCIARLGLPANQIWQNALQTISDAALLLLLVCVESQIDSFKALKYELKEFGTKRKRRSAERGESDE